MKLYLYMYIYIYFLINFGILISAKKIPEDFIHNVVYRRQDTSRSDILTGFLSTLLLINLIQSKE